VESRVGVGTTFSLLLPARVATASGSRQHVLVALGDQMERDFLAAILAGWGHSVSVADNGDGARARLRTGGIDAVFVDHAFVRADLETWRRARGTGGVRPSVVLLTSAEDDAGVVARECEAAAVLPPPFELRAVQAALRAISKECV
jgi:DNA-binding response OmpR family regulator